jgi:hypothetical protein
MSDNELLAVEHYRLHVIEQWPEGKKKDAALSSVRSAIGKLAQHESAEGWRCIICGRRAPASARYELPKAA